MLVVNLNKIKHNYQTLKSMLKRDTECAAVVKANAYGTGNIQVTQSLYDNGCRHFFYANLDEAIKVVENTKIDNANNYILCGVLPETEYLFTKYNFIPCLITYTQVERWVCYNRCIGKRLKCVLHVNTGMNREGLSFVEFNKLVRDNVMLDDVNVIYLMSHLANANVADDPMNEIQLKRFYQVCKLLPHVKATLANTDGIFLGPNYHFDLARTGMGLYGYNTYGGLKPALKLYSRILSTRLVPPNEPVGYDGTYVTTKLTCIALLAIGYGHGIPLSISNKGHIIINGVKSQIVGAVSMYLMTIDVTNVGYLPDWVEIYGNYESVKQFAHDAGTSVYEILVKNGERYHRVYVR